jgi:hypothetical protein
MPSAERVPRHLATQGKRLLFLHKGETVDAEVVEWLGKAQGSKHKLAMPDGTRVTTDLNECNHSEQHFETADKYEKARRLFCRNLRDSNHFVEDAITSRQLRIEDQIMLMAVHDNCGEKAKETWKKMNGMASLIELLLDDSADRHRGTHTAQPLLVCAGPGSGKTWMLKQTVYLLASDLYSTSRAGETLPYLAGAPVRPPHTWQEHR